MGLKAPSTQLEFRLHCWGLWGGAGRDQLVSLRAPASEAFASADSQPALLPSPLPT